MSRSDTEAMPLSLDLIQKWMQGVITHPGGIAGGLAAAAVPGLAVGLENIEEIVAPSATLSGAQRLGIYSRSYHARLIQCFQTMFPSLLRALGSDLFNAFALDYLAHHPPRSYTLDHLADAFPAYLAASRPDAGEPPERRESWPDFIIELATLELAFLKVFDGPGSEGLRLPASRDLYAVTEKVLSGARFVPVPCFRLFSFRYPVGEYLLAVRRKEEPELPEPAMTFMVLSRRNYRVMLHDLTPRQYMFLSALAEGEPVADALVRVEKGDPRGFPPIPEAREWLCAWTTRGFFERMILPEGSQ